MSGKDDAAPVAQECVEGYLFTLRPTELLILRRPPSRGAIWVPVSGKVEPSDPDFPSALRREISEETGGTGTPEKAALLDLDWHVRFDGPDGRPWRLHAYGVPVERRFTPTLSDEHDAFEWATVADARARLHYEDNRAAVDRLVERLGTVGDARE